MDFQTPIVFWFNKEHFAGTVFENAQPLTVFSDAELLSLVEDVLGTNYENLEVRGDSDDIPPELVGSAKFTVFIVDKEGWMKMAGWMDTKPLGW